jgi:two-component system, NtrC family, response regulator AtoC
VIEREPEVPKVLLVSRDSSVHRLILSLARSSWWRLEIATNAWQAIERLESAFTPDLLLLDPPSEDNDGLHTLRWLLRVCPTLPVILLGQIEDDERKQEAVRLGALDYMVMPGDDWQLGTLIQQHFAEGSESTGTTLMSDDVELVAGNNFFIGVSPVMRRLRGQVAMLAETKSPVLLLGEAGSGKETAARLVHSLSARSGFKFAKVNCAALPGDLLEKELFGCEPTRPTKTVPIASGKVEVCANGTILLDEITEMPMWLQASLLQFIEDKRFTRPGTATTKSVDVRILAASTTNMEHAVSTNKLREDLYARLSEYVIHVPPLRERKREIPLLACHFMHQLANHYALAPREFSAATIETLKAYAWPGNLRELESFVKRYLIVGDKASVFEKSRRGPDESDCGTTPNQPQHSGGLTPKPVRSQLDPQGIDSLRSLVRTAKSEAERNAITAALEKTGWNRKAAAQLLKISYRTLLYKIEQYQMQAQG